ncbi:MAG: hypothetical protein Q9170_007106 [Blastenia crenularia]
MSLLSPPRSRYALAIILWLSMLFLIWQHYQGLSQISGRLVNQGVPTWLPPSNSSASEKRPDEFTAVHPLQQPKPPSAPGTPNGIDALLSSVEKTSLFFVNNIPPPSDFRNVGDRLSILSTWITARDTLHPNLSRTQFQTLEKHIERTIISLFPFVRNLAQPKNAQPFSSLRQTFVKGSQGIVMVASKSNLRYLSHSILNIRSALNSSLPIQVFHSGEADFGPSIRRFVEELAHNVTTHDIKKIIPDSFVGFDKGGAPTIRVFAALASTFENVILVDPETIFLQTPEIILSNHTLFKQTGALFFHSHLYGKGDRKETHEFWQRELKNHPPSPSLRSSRTYNEGYAEEADANVVVLDKSRLSTLIGLFHVCWQNTKRVRKEYTYRYGNGDQESWWFGFELIGSVYAWGQRYGGTIGWLKDEGDGRKRDNKERVCGDTNLQVDGEGRPLFYRGTLARNRKVEEMGYEVPTRWMVGGVWQQSGTEGELDCMWGDEVRVVGKQETRVLEMSVEAAKRVDGDVDKVAGKKDRALGGHKED